MLTLVNGYDAGVVKWRDDPLSVLAGLDSLGRVWIAQYCEGDSEGVWWYDITGQVEDVDTPPEKGVYLFADRKEFAAWLKEV